MGEGFSSLKKRGFTLIEVLIALSIIGASFYALSTFMINNLKTSKNVSSLNDFNAEISLVELILSGDPVKCAQALQGTGGSPLRFDPGTTAPGSLSSPIGISSISPQGGSAIVANGTVVNGWKTTLAFDRIIQSAPPNFLVNLSVTKTRESKEIEVGASRRHRDIPVAITIDNSSKAIVSCSNSPDELKTMCVSLGGTFNVGTNQCDTCGTIEGTFIDSGTGKCTVGNPLPDAIQKQYRTAPLWGYWVRVGSNYLLTAGASCTGATQTYNKLKNNLEGAVYSSGCNEAPTGVIVCLRAGNPIPCP